MLAGPPRLVSIISVLVVLLLGYWYLNLVSFPEPPHHPRAKASSASGLRPGVDPLDFSIPLIFTPGIPKPPSANYSRILVLPKTTTEDIQWIYDNLPDLPLAVYEVDNASAKYRVPKNKGREAMVRPPSLLFTSPTRFCPSPAFHIANPILTKLLPGLPHLPNRPLRRPPRHHSFRPRTPLRLAQ